MENLPVKCPRFEMQRRNRVKEALKLYCEKLESIEPHFSEIFCLGYSELSRQLLGEGWILPPYCSI